MIFHFFHYDLPPKSVKKETKFIWFPLSRDLNTVLDYIRIHHKGSVVFHLENSFKPFVTNNNDDICYFHPTNVKITPVKRILFFAQSDTLAHSCWIMGEAIKHHFEVIYTVPKLKKEQSDTFFFQKGIPFTEFSAKLLKQFRPNLIVLLNDWSKQPQRIIALSRIYQIPTICMQESVIDFDDKFKRMRWADEVLIQGTQTIFDLKRNTYYLTGNPRYEILTQLNTNERSTILINCNFTYGIFEDVRDYWLQDIITCIDKLKIPYFISQHPRDTANLSKYKQVIRSSSIQVADQLKNVRCLVTRFSSLIHEALVAGIPVVYYNPHGEQMKYDFGFNNEFLLLATNKHELEYAIKKALNFSDFDKIKDYLVNHCIQKEKKPTQNLIDLFSNLRFKSRKLSIPDVWKLFIYHPYLLRLIWKIKKR